MKRTPDAIISPILNRETGALEGFRTSPAAERRNAVNRRSFLRGVGTVAIGLPFLEGLPERSAWAADAAPVFSYFMVAACGVVGSKFFPSATGALTTSGLQGESGKAVSEASRTVRNVERRMGSVLASLLQRVHPFRRESGLNPGSGHNGTRCYSLAQGASHPASSKYRSSAEVPDFSAAPRTPGLAFFLMIKMAGRIGSLGGRVF